MVSVLSLQSQVGLVGSALLEVGGSPVVVRLCACPHEQGGVTDATVLLMHFAAAPGRTPHAQMQGIICREEQGAWQCLGLQPL